MKFIKLIAVCLSFALVAPIAVQAGDTPISKKAHLYIGWPNDGEIIRAKRFKVWFGLRNAGVAPAGEVKPNAGHHHLLIDVPLPPEDEPIPSDENYIHFGSGQTETYIELEPGRHTLQLLFADHNHIPHNKVLASKRITITVDP